MNVCKLLFCDIREGILSNKRYGIAPLLALFQCMYVHFQLQAYMEYYQMSDRPTIFELLVMIFSGCDPIAKNPNQDTQIAIPYLWMAIFVFAVFVTFDYMHKDLTQFGIQILTRTGKRLRWWLAKCIWCLMAGLWFFVLFMLTVMAFCLINGYSLHIPQNTELLNMVSNRSIVYIFHGVSQLSGWQCVYFLAAPAVVLCTLNMLQMLLCLICKPMHGYLIVVGMLSISLLADSPVAFPRCAMIPMNIWFYQDSFSPFAGLAVCLLLILACMILGALYFRRYDILPDKE